MKVNTTNVPPIITQGRDVQPNTSTSAEEVPNERDRDMDKPDATTGVQLYKFPPAQNTWHEIRSFLHKEITFWCIVAFLRA